MKRNKKGFTFGEIVCMLMCFIFLLIVIMLMIPRLGGK